MKKIIGSAIALMLCLLVLGCSNSSTTTTTAAGAVTTMQTVTTMATATTRAATIAPSSADVRLLGKQGFDPETVTIKVGGTVTWIVVDNVARTNETNPELDRLNKATYHVIASTDGKIRSGRLGPGDKFSHTFTEKGTVEYINVIYGVKGKVVVE